MSLGLGLALVLLLPAAGALAVALVPRRWLPFPGFIALGVAMASLCGVLAIGSKAGAHPSFVLDWSWVPECGLSLSFLVDGLSLFFAVIVLGMGVLVLVYSRGYMAGREGDHRRFYAGLLFFMGSMLGTVFSNNLLLLFIFWELTGLASFLLIGFEHTSEEARRGARMSLLVTAVTGLVMLLGIVMLKQVTGTYDLATILRSPLPQTHKDWLDACLVLLVVGAFGKSAIFPFHFWLPNAMTAPTPVSAYLHSATMVKLGIFLCARLFPIFGERELWAPLLGVPAFSTMLLGAVLALMSSDLKAILAYSTVSQLGYLIGYYALGPNGGVDYDYLHILNHLFYKGSLFMVAGIVEHAAGSRDIGKLGGLAPRLPLTAASCAIACAAMAGLPLTTGFLSKEFMLKEIFSAFSVHGYLGSFAVVCVVLTSLLKVAFSAKIILRVFFGKEPETVTAHFHAPSAWMTLPPAVLSGCALLAGIAPSFLNPLLQPFTVPGLHAGTAEHFQIWHGWTRELWVSLAVVLAGLALYRVSHYGDRPCPGVPSYLKAERLFEWLHEKTISAGRASVRLFQTDREQSAVLAVTAFAGVTLGAFAWKQVFAGGFGPLLQFVDFTGGMSPLRLLVGVFIVLPALGLVLFRSWGGQLACLGISGFMVTVYFVLGRAPDLALTQLLVETVSIVAIYLLLGRCAKQGLLEQWSDLPSSAMAQGLRVAVSCSVAAAVGVLILVVTGMPHHNPVGNFFIRHTEDMAHGKNAVNTILVDFRGLDTLGEITVLLAAMLGCLGLLMRYRRNSEEQKQGRDLTPGLGLGEEGKS